MRVMVKGQGQGEGGRPTFAFFIWSICPCSAEISRQRSLFSRSRVAYSFCRFLSPRISSVRWRSRSWYFVASACRCFCEARSFSFWSSSFCSSESLPGEGWG